MESGIAYPAGIGLLIYRLKDCLPIARLIAAVHRAGASWVSIKIQDGAAKINQITESGKTCSNDSFLLQLIAALEADGIRVGGWPFIYPLPTVSPGNQAGVTGERVEKLKLKHILIDAENVSSVGAIWESSPDRKRSANTYMDQLRSAGVPLSLPVGLCSDRFPTLHATFPRSNFINHPSSNLVAPQVYWQGAQNAAEQLERSMREHASYRTLGPSFPFMPIGAAYGANVGGKLWEPTVASIEEFTAKAIELKLSAWGWYSLDYVLSKNKPEWLDAMRPGGHVEPPPVIPPEPVVPEAVVINVSNLSVRSEPGIKPDTVIGYALGGKIWKPMASVKDEAGLEWYQVGKAAYIAAWKCRPA